MRHPRYDVSATANLKSEPDIVANDLPGDGYAMHPATGAYLIDIPDRITDSVIIEIDPVLEMGPMAVAAVMNSLEEIAS